MLPKGKTIMALFDTGQGIASTITNAGAAAGAITGTFNSIANGGASLKSLAEGAGDIFSAVAAFSDDNASDWRVRLSLPTWPSFRTSPVLAPLKDAGGLIFPYTPTITMGSNSTYNQIPLVHTNTQFQTFKSSQPDSIVITAPMNVEDPVQGLYWIAAAHYLRSLSKMFSGNDPKAGNPPPIVMLNGYGNYVFKNVPVALKSFSTTLPNDCDYIGVDVVGSAAGNAAGIADSIGGLSDTMGGLIPQLSGITNMVSSVAGTVGQVAGIAGTFGIGGTTSGGKAYVPTKSSFKIELVPMYSRNSTRKFSLDRFVTGGYLNNPFGYI